MMKMYDEEGWTLFELTEAQSDVLFHAFNPMSDNSSMRDFRNHHRWPKEHLEIWLTETVGPRGIAWKSQTYCFATNSQEISFADRRHAAMFKLIHGF